MSRTVPPGRTASIPTSRLVRVTSTSRREASSTSPTRKVALVSPCTPSRKMVTSQFTMSPSWSTVESGIPWQMTSFTLVHSDFGNGMTEPP